MLNIYLFESIRCQVEKPKINPGRSPTIPLDTKYENIRSEAMQAGLLLKETDEKIDEIISDSDLIKSHAYDVRTNALKFYRNLMKSEKLVRFCQILFFLIVGMIVVIFLGKSFRKKKHG